MLTYIYTYMRTYFFNIGLQERWNTSIELFHHKYGGKLFQEELSVRRKAAKEGQRQEMEKAVRAGIYIHENIFTLHPVFDYDITSTHLFPSQNIIRI